MTTRKKPDIEALDRVEVFWRDAWYVNHWEGLDDYETEAVPMHSVGFFLESTDDYLIIAQTVGIQLGHVFRIPLACVISMEQI